MANPWIFGAGWATFGLALPRGAAPAGAKVGDLVTQADRKTSHPDGSWRFGVVTTKVVTPGAYVVAPAAVVDAAPLASIAWPSAVVTFLISGVPYVAALPAWTPSDKPWLSGALVRESRAVVVPTYGSGTVSLMGAVSGPAIDASLMPSAAATPAVDPPTPSGADEESWDGDGSLIGHLIGRGAAVGGEEPDEPDEPYVESWESVTAHIAEAVTQTGWGEQPLAPSDDGRLMAATAATPHPALQVVFDVRSYLGGGHRVDVTVQNSRDAAGAVGVIYDVAITIDGTTVFSRTSVKHHWRRRWRRVFPAQGVTLAAVTPDFTSAIEAGTLEHFRPTVADLRYDISSDAFDILQFGTMQPSMGSPGGRPDIACYPWWAAQAIVHRKADQIAHVIRCGELAGSWNGYLMGPDGVSLIRLDQRPNYTFGGQPPDGPTPHAAADPPSMGSVYDVDPTHVPSLSHVPYVITGDRYFLDTQKAWANHIMIGTYTGDAYAFGADVGGLRTDRKLYVGSLAPRSTEPRGAGWGMRELIHAAEDTPDDDPDQLYLQVCLKNNLVFYETYGNRPKQGYFNAPFADFDPGTLHTGYASQSMWQASYLAWAIDYARRKGFGPGGSLVTRTVTTIALAFKHNPAYAAAMYYQRWGEYSGYVPGVQGTGTHRWFASPEEWFDANYAHPTEINNLDFDPGLTKRVPLSSGYIEGYYGSDYRMMLLIGVRDGIAGAAEALAWLERYGNGVVLSDIDFRSGYALMPFGSAVLPTPIPIPDPTPVPTPTPTPTPTRTMTLSLAATQAEANIDPSTLNYRIVVPVIAPTPPPTPVPTGHPQSRFSFADPATRQPLKGPYAAGQIVPAEIIAINVGTGDATDVEVIPTLEGGTIIQAATDAYDLTTGKWTIGDLPHSPPGQSLEKLIGVTVKVQD